MKIRFKILILVIIVLFCNIACDQGTKVLAREHLQGKARIDVVGDIFVLQYAENTGAFLSFGAELHQPFKFILLIFLPALIILAALVYLILSKKFNYFQVILIASMIGGGASNLFDRIYFDGRVTDFMNFGIGGLRTGILNFADLSITFGVVLLIIEEFIREHKKKKEKAALAFQSNPLEAENPQPAESDTEATMSESDKEL